MAPRQGIEPRPKVLETLVLPEHLRDKKQQDNFCVSNYKFDALLFAELILKLV